MAVTPGFLGIDEPAAIDKRADTNVMTRAATVVHREVVSIGSPDDATPESIAKVDSTGSLRTVSTDAAGTNQQAITAAGDAKITLDGEAVVLGAGAANIGDVDVLTQPARSHTTDSIRIGDGTDLALVTAAGALVVDGSGVTQPVSGPLTDAQLRATPVPVSGTVTANAGTGTRDVQGNVAHDAADSGNPVKIGGKARTTNPTAVADGDRADAFCDDLGKQVVRPYVPRDLITQNTITLTSTTETTLLAQVASTFLDLIQIVAINTSATAVRVDIRDSTTGTIRFALYLPAGDTRGVVFQIPIPQATVNTNWTAQLSAAVTDVRIFALAVRDV